MILGVVVSVIFFMGFLFLGMPVYATIFAALFAAVFLLSLSPTIIPTTAFFTLTGYTLIAIPLFLLMGDLMTEGGVSSRLVALANAFVGRIKGGLAHVLVVASLFFGTLTGSATATTAAIGSIMIPRMEEYGWDRSYSAALTACASPLGLLIPPSILAILYAYVAHISVGRLFLASVVPGIILALAYMAITYFWGANKWYHPTPLLATEKPRGMAREIARAALAAFPGLLSPLIILGGIYAGVFTATEASAIGCAWAFIVGFFFYKGLRARSVFQVTLATSILNSALFLILVPMAPYVKALVMAGMGDALINFITGISTNVYIVLLMLNVLLIVLGMVIDVIPIILAIVPLFLPLFEVMGFDPIYIGTVILVNLGFGLMTPPFAINLFVAAKVGKVPITDLFKPAFVFLVTAGLPTLLLTTYIPQLTLWLPNLIMGPGH